MSQGSSSSSGGIGFFGALAILFIGLRITGHIGWSWWLVLAPLWGPLALCLAILPIGALALLFAAGIDRIRRPAKERRRARLIDEITKGG